MTYAMPLGARTDFPNLVGSGAVPFLSPLNLYLSLPKRDAPFSKFTSLDRENYS